MTSAPLSVPAPNCAILVADGVRIAVDDVIALDRVTCSSRGDRVLLLGDAAPLVAALTGVSLRSRSAPPPTRPDPPSLEDAREPGGECRVVAGLLHVAGVDVAEGKHLAPRATAPGGVAGAAPLDPPLPAGWTALEYLTWGARLAGHGRGVARDLAMAALERVGLGAALKMQARALALPARRALVLAQAAIAAPAVVIAEAPLRGLDGAGAAFVLRALASVTEGRGAIVSQSHFDPGAPEAEITRGATDVLVFAGGELSLDAPAAELLSAPRLYAVTVRTNADLLRTELSARGIALRGGPHRFAATLPHGLGASDILAAASAARAAVVDVYPLLA